VLLTVTAIVAVHALRAVSCVVVFSADVTGDLVAIVVSYFRATIGIETHSINLCFWCCVAHAGMIAVVTVAMVFTVISIIVPTVALLLPVSDHIVGLVHHLWVHILSLHELVLQIMDEFVETTSVGLDEEHACKKLVMNGCHDGELVRCRNSGEGQPTMGFGCHSIEGANLIAKGTTTVLDHLHMSLE